MHLERVLINQNLEFSKLQVDNQNRVGGFQLLPARYLPLRVDTLIDDPSLKEDKLVNCYELKDRFRLFRTLLAQYRPEVGEVLVNHPKLKKIELEESIAREITNACRDLADMESADLKNELLIGWAQPAFSDGSLKSLDLKSLCLLLDSMMHEKIYKDYNFLMKNEAFINETEKSITDSLTAPALYFPYFTSVITDMKKLLFKETFDAQIDKIFDNGGGQLLMLASRMNSEESKQAE